jgi:predicted PurR-regulated permease PerM
MTGKPNHWPWLIILAISLVLIYLLSPILTPFLLGALLAYLGDPLADRLEAKNLSRNLSVSIVFIGIISSLLVIFLLFVPVIESQLSKLFNKLPEYIDTFVAFAQPSLQRLVGVDISVIEANSIKNLLTDHLVQTGGIIKNILKAVSNSSLVILNWLTTIALTPVITFYLLRDWDKLVAYIQDLIPRNVEPTISHIARESDAVLGEFLRGQLTVMLALTTMYSVGLGLIGIEFALLIGMIAGLVSFIPYLGLIIGVIIAGAAVLFQGYNSLDLFLVFVVFTLAQIIESIFLTPLLVGEKIGLHPVTVIFSVLAGGQLFGFFGILLALPVAAILAVILRHLHDSYKESNIYTIAKSE